LWEEKRIWEEKEKNLNQEIKQLKLLINQQGQEEKIEEVLKK
jgi:hypothetical protein